MSYDKNEKYLNDMEALKEYPNVKRERDEFKEKFERSTHEKKLDQDAITALKENNRVLSSRLAEEELYHKDLEAQLKAKDDELSQLEVRVGELENLTSITSGKTLAETEKTILEAEQEEIGKQAEERAKKKYSEWVKIGKPKEVSEEAIRLLHQTIDGLRMPVHVFPMELALSRLPEKVEQIIQEEVKQNLNDEFKRRVEADSEKRAQEKIIYLVNIEWPKWKKENVEPKIIEMDSKIKANALAQLIGPWVIPCDRCLKNLSVKIGPEEMSRLLRSGFVDVPCDNPNCPGKSIFSGNHKRRVQLADLISWRIVSPY